MKQKDPKRVELGKQNAAKWKEKNPIYFHELGKKAGRKSVESNKHYYGIDSSERARKLVQIRWAKYRARKAAEARAVDNSPKE